MLLLGVVQAQFQAAAQGGIAGYVFGLGGTTTIQKINFSTDGITTLAATTSNNGGTSGSANSGVAGYYKPGTNFETVVDKLLFSSETRSSLASGMSGSANSGAGFADSGVASYMGRGRDGGASSSAVIDKFNHSTDSRSTLGTGLARISANPGSFADTGVAGYVVGGFDYAAFTNIANVNKFSFPSDSRTTLSNIPSAVRDMGAFENKGVAGYVLGGSDLRSSSDKFAFPSDTRSTVSGILPAGRRGSSYFGPFNVGQAGYMVAGDVSAGATNTVVKVSFASDTGSLLAATMANSGAPSGAASNNGIGY
jgi:hypothetical protein